MPTIFEAIDACDAKDEFYFAIHKDLLWEDLPKHGMGLLKELVQLEFHGHHLFLAQVERKGNKGANDIALRGLKDKHGHWHVKFNLPKFLLLPCVDTKAELLELRTLFAAMTEFFEDFPEYFSQVAVYNERDNHGKVYGELHCGVRNEDKSPALKLRVEAHTERLRAVVAASPILQAWLRNAALSLGKIGRYSSAFFNEEQLYGCVEGPHMKYLLQKSAAGELPSAEQSEDEDEERIILNI